MLEVLTNILICSFEIYMLHDLGKSILSVRPDKMKNYCIAVISIVVFVAVNSFNNTHLNLICVPVIYCLYSVFCFENSCFKKVCIALCYYILAIVPEFIFASIISVSSNSHLKSRSIDLFNSFLLTMLMKMITFILVKLIGSINKEHDYRSTNNRMFFLLLILPISTAILLAGMFYADIHIIEARKALLIVGVSLLLAVNVYMFVLFEKIVDNSEKITKIEKLYMKSKVENTHLQQIEKVNEEHSMLLHDINKFLRTAAELVADGEKHEAMAIFEQLDIKIKDSRNRIYCESKILNAILCERKERAESFNIDYKVNISEDLYVDFIEDIDLISIVGNLIDNAMEAASQVSFQRFVEIDLYMANECHFLVLEVKNNFVHKPILGRKGFISSKRDQDNHGIGIHTVEKVIQKYGGKLKIDITSQEFLASIIFHVNKK